MLRREYLLFFFSCEVEGEESAESAGSVEWRVESVEPEGSVELRVEGVEPEGSVELRVEGVELALTFTALLLR